MWSLHDRIEEYIGGGTRAAEVDSIDRNGQLVPALGRPVRGEVGCEIELIYGARRLHIARQLNRPLRVVVREMSDLEAIVAMDAENRLRKDISPYERGMSYARMLQSGLFESQEELAQALDISASQVSRMLKLTRLPSVILAAFPTPLEICEAWGLALATMWEDPEARPALSRVARALSKRESRLQAWQVYEQLVSARAPRPRKDSSDHDEVVTNPEGAPLFRVRRQRDSVVLVLPLRSMSSSQLIWIKDAVSRALQGAAHFSGDEHIGQTHVIRREAQSDLGSDRVAV
jgi:ParB family chromosome partitioning protein